MDFSKYNNIREVIRKFGGVKQTLLNKNLYAEAEESWNIFSEEDLNQINSEIASATQVYKTLITSKAVCIYSMHTFMAIPVTDILWIYNRVVTQKMNFIPYNKIHYLMMFTKSGNTYEIGQTNTGGFSKKTPNDEVMKKIQNALSGVRKGIVYGADEEMYRLCTQDLAAAIAKVDADSM